MYKILIITLFAIILLPIFAVTVDSSESNEIEEFENWASDNGITIVGAIGAGYITVYSTKSDLENFAENFAYYIVYPNVFREKIQTDTLLAEKYEFMRDKIFSGLEYQ